MCSVHVHVHVCVILVPITFRELVHVHVHIHTGMLLFHHLGYLLLTCIMTYAHARPMPGPCLIKRAGSATDCVYKMSVVYAGMLTCVCVYRMELVVMV